MASSQEIFETLRNIIVETRGVEEDEVTQDANLFNQLGLESIDFLEISFRMEEEFGFPFPTDELGNALGNMGEDSTESDVVAALDRLENEFHIPLDRSKLTALDPYDATALRSQVVGLFTVSLLVGYVQNRSAAS